MHNPRLDRLVDYPFQRLNRLLDGLTPSAPGLSMAVGEPRLAPPAMAMEILAAEAASYGRYPPTLGTDALRQAIGDWLARRFTLPTGLLDWRQSVLVTAGSREALFLAAQVALPQRKAGAAPLVGLPNPFYQVYLGAAVMAGGKPVLAPTGADTDFLPDFEALGPAVLDRMALAYVCTPANPQGSIAGIDYLEQLVRLARRHDFVLACDECYSELYLDEAPAGALQACARIGEGLDNVLVFNSLSKRSSGPGLRSGFVAGDPALIALMGRLRSYAGATVPLPMQAASVALWNDEAHVEAARARYRANLAAASRVLGQRPDFFAPKGGFFLWLNVAGRVAPEPGLSPGEVAARRLWAEAGIRAVPGAYFGRTDTAGFNPGNDFLRLALVDEPAHVEAALGRVAALV